MTATLLGHRSRSLAILILTLGLIVPWLPARGDDAGLLSQVRPRMQVFVDQGEIAGAVTVIGRRDGILNIEAVGFADIENQRPMTKDAVFKIASMTKPITAIGIMILTDHGKLSVEDPVEKYLPEFRGQMMVASRDKDAGTVTLKKAARPIIIRDLLTHTSGLPGWPPGLSDLYTKRHRTLAEGVLAISQRPLEFEPGSKWAYCNPGIDTLGRIIEVVSGQTYEDFLGHWVFKPVGMPDTTFYPTPAQRERLAVTYAKKDGKLVPAPGAIIDLPATGGRYPIPAGGLYSTATDLARLYQVMLNRGVRANTRFLSERAIGEMTRLQTGDIKTGFVDGMGFGFGWGVVREPKGVTEALSSGSYGHGGAFGTQAWLDPEKDLFTVLLIQRTGLQNADASPMRKQLQALAVAAAKH